MLSNVTATLNALIADLKRPTKLPFTAWGTKGFEFWTLLSVILKEARPQAILELGCGRSSTFFADYAHAYGAIYLGIENDLRWFNKTNLDIDLLGFEKRHLVHVELHKMAVGILLTSLKRPPATQACSISFSLTRQTKKFFLRGRLKSQDISGQEMAIRSGTEMTRLA